ncbi:hypothetical protein Pmani_004708 [Petrolisthes manimaculis]|uniref:Uncharacterized protein n=1 Tax=Petrolisthes manimaculis TaxID=1843537 RepID=A0AAE1QED0_9EUCA|nr:hypothetical protein Pmani_004708 [Petrolisthes manimaculis]
MDHIAKQNSPDTYWWECKRPVPGVCGEVLDEGDGDLDEYYPDTEDDANGCHPEEADRCWVALQENLLCHMDTPTGRNCTMRDAADFCVSLDDALACCVDIIDTSCSDAEGRATFDVWLKGLHAVYSHVCLDDTTLDLVNELLESGRCWRLKRFSNCVEETANLTHVSDLLTTHLDLLACSRLQAAIATCTANSEKNRGRCRGKGQAVLEGLVAFFSATSCGLNLTSSTSPTATQQQCPATGPTPPQPMVSSNGNGGGGGVAVAVVVTMVVMMVVVGVVALVLGRYGILTLYVSKLRYRRADAVGSSGGDGDGDAGALYNNF